MSIRKRIALVTLLVIFVVSLLLGSVLVACDKNKGDGNYSIYVKSLGGLGLSDVTVTVTNKNSAVATGTTDKNGLFTFKADPGVYDVAVTNLPIGYTLTSNGYKTSKDSDTLTILASSSVIMDTVPSNKVYKVGDVAYDFSIDDKTDRDDTKTYTLSQLLAEKKMVLLNFWNTGCRPCVSEMPALELAYRQYQDVAEVLAINVSGFTGIDKWPAVRDFKSKSSYTDDQGNTYSLTFPMSLDDQDGNNMPFHFAMNGIPTSVVIDRYGVIAMIHTGGMDLSTFKSVFEKYTSDNYVQDQVGGGGGSGGGEIEREKPNVSMPASSEIEKAINGNNFHGTYRPETEAEDAEYSWPWLVGETNGEKYIYPANTGVNYSFATIYTSVTISQNDVTNNGNVVLAFDVQWSTEFWGDYFYVLINNSYVYSYTGTDQWGKWQTCYALVANQPGTYDLTLLYYKDEQQSEGFDTVRVRNMQMMSVNTLNNSTPSLDMPRDAANMNKATSQYDYVTAVKGDDGYYHKDSATGPYILAELMNPTNFNKRLEIDWGINSFAINGDFNYNTVDEDDPRYDKDLDDTYAITLWAQAANNSELYGLTIVNDELIELLNRFIISKIGEDNFNDKMWLEYCKYFDHYGSDKKDKGICDMTRNPIRGLMNSTAIPTVQAYEGELDLDNIPAEYTNKVTFDRILVPRGLMYLFVPKTSGVYRFRTQSFQDLDTMGWLYDYEGATTHSSTEGQRPLVSTDEQRENPDKSYNLVLTYYLEAGQKYIFISCLSDIAVYGYSYTFTVEHLGAEAYVWQYTGRGVLTYIEDENGEVGEIRNFHNVEFAIGDDGYVYVAQKDSNGKYVKDSNGKYVPNTNDPLYVDFVTEARFFDPGGSLEKSLKRGERATIVSTVSEILSKLWNKSKPTANGWTASTALTSIKGSAITKDDWQEINLRFLEIYGDSAYIDNNGMMNQLMSCTTVGAIADLLKKYFLDLFDMREIRFDERYGIDSSLYKNYTSLVTEKYNEAKANTGIEELGKYDADCVKLTVELMNALNMFTKRVGGYPELDTEWLSLCAHYEYMGPAK